MTQGVLFEELGRCIAPELSEYDAFVEKFKPKKTTDDCYTPANIYDAVADWCAAEYGLDRRTFVRPFYPGGDYEHFAYPDGCCVVDNPPFSILAKIADFYLAHDIKFFLFAPALTIPLNRDGVCAICAYVSIIYKNRAKVRTSFLTNMDSARARTAPKLTAAVQKASDDFAKSLKQNLPPIYQYPSEFVTAAMLGQLSYRGVDVKIMPQDCSFVRALDAQHKKNKAVFGGGLLVSHAKAAELAKAKKAAELAKAKKEAELAKAKKEAELAKAKAAIVWQLSDRERAICDALDGGDAHGALFDNK